jgi:hypothetical protein
MSSRSQLPLEAKVLPDLPPPRPAGSGNAWNWICAACAFFGFVAIFAILLAGIGQWISGGRQLAPGRRGSLLQHWETSSERLAAVKAALETRRERPTAAELRELDRFFARVAGSTQLTATARLEALFDLDALTDRVLRHPAIGTAKPGSRERLRRQMEYENSAWPGWTKITVVAVTRGASDELLVYTIADGNGGHPAPARWWLRRQGRSWRIGDWERIDVGYSDAARRALDETLLATDQHAAFRRATTAIQGAITNREASNIPLAAQQLLDVQNAATPDLVHDLINIELALVWHTCSRPDQVIAACDRVRDPAANPAVHYLRALAHAEREQFAETVAAAAAYREAAGRHPHLLVLEAAALEALGRRGEAARSWRDRLELLPGDARALAEFCRLAEDQRAAELKEILQQNRAPLETALNAGLTAAEKQDDATYDAVMQFLRATPGGSAMALRLAGERLAGDGESQPAAEHFLQASREPGNPDFQRVCFERYLDVMASSGRAAAAYAQAAAPEEAFAYLTRGLEDGDAAITVDDLPLLLAVHRQREPADGRLHYYQGLCELADGKAEEAERTFAAGEAAAQDDEQRERLRGMRLEALVALGRVADAYAAYGADSELMFRELGWLCSRARDWKALDALIEQHREQKPADPWIDYFLALRYEAQGNDAEALAAARRADGGRDEALGSQLDWLKDNLLIRVEGVTQAYIDSSDQREAFRRLVNHLAAAEDWDGILELTELHASSGSGRRRSSTIYWAAKAQWNGGEYEKIVASLSPWPYDRLARLDGQQISELYDIAVRSLLRLGRIEEAAETARQARDEYGLELPQMAVALAKRDRAPVRELLEERRIARALFHRQLHRDRDLTSLLTDPDVADFRRQHALAWPQEYGPRNVSLVLLYEQPLPAAEIEAARGAAAALGEASESAAADGRHWWQWSVGADTLVLTSDAGAYCRCDDLPDWLPADDQRRTVLERHGGWAAVDLLPADQAIRNSPVRVAAAKVAAALAARGALACYVVGPRGRVGEPTLMDAAVIDQIESGRIFRAEAGAARQQSFYLPPPPAVERTALSRSPLQRELVQLAHNSRVAKAEGHALLRVRLARGHAVEDLWLRTIRSRRASSATSAGGEEFIGELIASSRLWPHLKTGERLIVGLHEPLEIAPVGASSAEGNPPSGGK